MRVNLICLFSLTLTVSLFGATKSSGQSIHTKNVVFSSERISLKEALSRLEKVTGVTIFYPTEVVDRYMVSTISEEKRSIAETLDVLLRNTDLRYKESNGNIVLSLKSSPDGSSISEADQNLRVSGIVLDKTGTPLSGVTVMVENWKDLPQTTSSTSTATDRAGHWGLVVPNENVKIVFTYLGYASMVKGFSELKENGVVVLEQSIGNLDEVMVIGYGTTTRRGNTGSVSSITSDQISKQTVGNPMQALPGRIAGMTVVQNNGLPGSNTTVQIRGNNTLGANGLSGALPLYVVDGVPFVNFNGGQPATDNLNAFGLNGANGGVSPFSVINPQDIERIDVLKDADATAIFGARGANGVIMITTKKGVQGKSSLNVNFYQGTGRVGRFVDMLNTEQYLDLRREAFNNDGVSPTNSNAPDLMLWDQNAYTDWQDKLIGGTANITDAQVSYSGGGPGVRYFTSVNYRKDGTVFLGDMGADRFSGRMTLETSSADRKFNMQLTANYANDNTDLIMTDITSALSLPPNYPLYNDDGSLYWGGGFTNPMANLLKKYYSTTTNLITNANLRYEVLKGWNIKANLGYTRTGLDQRNEDPISSQNPTTQVNNRATFVDNRASNYIFEPQMDYVTQISEGKLTALVGGTWQENLSKMTRLNGTNYTYEALLNTISGAGTVATSNNYSLYRYASAFGRLNYDWKGKYIVNGTFRRDASSRFGDNNKFANFGAVGAAWIITEEKGIKERLPFLSFAKLRGSYGSTGNDQLPNYQYLSLFNIGGSGLAYQNIIPLVPGIIANPDLRWETTKKLEFGLDLSFFADRLSFTGNIYRHRSSNLLTYVNLPTQVGSNSYNSNLDALVENRGLELELNSVNVRNEHFRWSSAFNISFQRNELVSFGEVTRSFYATSFAIGTPLNAPRMFSYLGIDPNNGAVLYNDLDGVAGTNFNTDRYFGDIGTPFFGGLNNTFEYKNFSLDVFLQFNNRRGNINSVYGSRIGSLNNQNISVLDRWQNAGDEATLWPAATAVAGNPVYSSWNNFSGSDVFYENASFLKLRSFSLSYTVPSTLANRMKMSNLRVYTQGQNLLTFAKNKYQLDPESGNAMPPLRTIVFGINCTF